MKNLYLSAAIALGLAAPAFAQSVNQVPQIGTIASILRNPTYTAVSVNLVPPAAATDFFCISGTTKNILIRRISITGVAGTAVTVPILVYRRDTPATGGTLATGVSAPAASAMLSTDPASVATVVAYTTNPTITDNTPTPMAGPAVSFGLTTSYNQGYELLFGSSVDMFAKGIDIAKGKTQQICLNLNGATIASPVLSIQIQWQEVL